ncbi:MAG: hypothetical protein M5U05_19265 [Anaerolineales bacterium]|nr:hypothetical protein [Anaerolineales bacterium]
MLEDTLRARGGGRARGGPGAASPAASGTSGGLARGTAGGVAGGSIGRGDHEDLLLEAFAPSKPADDDRDRFADRWDRYIGWTGEDPTSSPSACP